MLLIYPHSAPEDDVFLSKSVYYFNEEVEGNRQLVLSRYPSREKLMGFQIDLHFKEKKQGCWATTD